MNSETAVLDSPALRRRDWQIILLIGVAHSSSHFFQLVLPSLYVSLGTEFGLDFARLGLLVSVFYVVSGLGQASSGFVVDRIGARPVLWFGLACFVLSAVLIGAAAGVGCYWGATGLKRWLGADDSLDVFGVHAVGGLIGALLTGVLADPRIGGVTGSLQAQAVAAGATLLYSGVVTAAILWAVDAVIGLRVTARQEHAGLDLSQHGERVE